MVSQSATRILELAAVDEPGKIRATLELTCGCVVTRTVARDRILDDVDPPRAVGKYPCPEGHGVGRG